MNITKILGFASAATGAVANAPCRLSGGEDSLNMQPGGARIGHAAADFLAKAPQERGAMVNLATRWSKCLDVKDGRFANGGQVQLWDCAPGSKNQGWQITGNTLKSAGGKCLDLVSGNVYPGAGLQLWDCDNGNMNQWFEVAGNSIRKKNSNYCLDVKDGSYDPGAALQVWPCVWSDASNQYFTFNTPKQTSQQNPSGFAGYTMISLDAFVRTYPECAPFKGAFENGAKVGNIPPTLLAAIAMQESTCRERPPSNSAGLMQWMDLTTFNKLNPGKDPQNAWDAAYASGRYIRLLLDQNSQNLDAALRGYNGPVGSGGLPSYQSDIRGWCSGQKHW